MVPSLTVGGSGSQNVVPRPAAPGNQLENAKSQTLPQTQLSQRLWSEAQVPVIPMILPRVSFNHLIRDD